MGGRGSTMPNGSKTGKRLGGGYMSKASSTHADGIMTSINDKLLTLADKGGRVGDSLNRLQDMRVSVRDINGKVAVSYPRATRKNKELHDAYDKITRSVTNKYRKTGA